MTLNMASGATQVVDNNGNSYPLQDDIFIQKPQSCVLSSSGALTVTAAVSSAAGPDREANAANLLPTGP